MDMVPQEILFKIASRLLHLPIEDMENIHLLSSSGNYLKFKLKTKYNIIEFSIKL